MSKVKNELEELSFRYLEPQTYEALRARVDAKRRATEGLIDQLKTTIQSKLRDASIPFVEVDGRIKRLWSISQKLKRQRIELEQVYDFIALRIITSSVKDCYAALGIIHQTWSPVPGRIKDFIAMPRPNGYQSLHTSVIGDHGMPFEVQIRTMEMHRMAEEGHRGALEIQRGTRRRSQGGPALPVAPAAARVPAGRSRPAGVHPAPQSRALSRGGVHVHPEGPGQGLPARRDADRLCVRHSYRHRPPMRRGPRQRQDGSPPRAA